MDHTPHAEVSGTQSNIATIRQWYTDAETLLTMSRELGGFGTRAAGALNPEAPNGQKHLDVNHEKVRDYVRSVFPNAIDLLQKERNSLDSRLDANLAEAITQACRELPPIEVAELPSGFIVWPPLTRFIKNIRDWAFTVLNFVDTGHHPTLKKNPLHALYSLVQECPYSESTFEAIRQRMLRERRYAVAEAEQIERQNTQTAIMKKLGEGKVKPPKPNADAVAVEGLWEEFCALRDDGNLPSLDECEIPDGSGKVKYGPQKHAFYWASKYRSTELSDDVKNPEIWADVREAHRKWKKRTDTRVSVPKN